MTETVHGGVTTESEEMYLITVAMAVEDGRADPVPVPYLADALAVSKVAANEMIKKLEARGLVTYEPYRGVRLTEDGGWVARTVLRRRRLWALFLADHLGLSPEAADEVACEFEHVTPREVAGRLAEFLGDPTVGPQGKPIPADSDEAPAPAGAGSSLADLTVGRRGRVVDLPEDPAVRAFLVESGLGIGSEVTVSAVGAGGGWLVATGRGTANLDAGLARSVRVSVDPG